jgi:DNA-binding PadR family transcriptional regulator
MRRKPGVLLPIEISILVAGLDLDGRGVTEFHGYLLATEIADRDGARRLMAHGSLYRALGRLEDAGLLESRWEDPDIGTSEGRPRRRLYHVTSAGARAMAGTREAPETRSVAGAQAGLGAGARAGG